MIYKIFKLQGNAEQIQIAQEALESIKFPWEVIKHPKKGHFTCGWANLNGQQFADAKLHQGDHPDRDDGTDQIVGQINGRKYVLGVFYPSSGNIYVDSLLVKYPEIAKQTISAEVAHLVDQFYMSDDMRREIYLLAHDGADTPHGHTIWWERADYGTEYFNLVAESFMAGFTLAYSDMELDQSSFAHKFTREQAPEIRRIIGLERTDAGKPVIEPEPIPEPEPEPFPTLKVIGKSQKYHRITHLKKKPGRLITDPTGFVPCKKCRP